MTDRIVCHNCNAQSYAEGATLYCKTCYDALEAKNAKLVEQLKYSNAMFVSAQSAIIGIRRLNETLKARIAVMRTKQEGK